MVHYITMRTNPYNFKDVTRNTTTLWKTLYINSFFISIFIYIGTASTLETLPTPTEGLSPNPTGTPATADAQETERNRSPS